MSEIKDNKEETVEELLIKCECHDEILGIEYLTFFEDFSLAVYRRRWFKKKNCIGEIILKPEDAKKIVDYLQKWLKESEYRKEAKQRERRIEILNNKEE